MREALRQLEAEGLVTFSPHRGAVVSTLSLDEIDELFELRAEIECDLLRRAIPRMSSEQLDRAIDVLDEFQDALRAGEATRWGPLNWHFHAALYAPANRNLTMGVLQKLHQHSDRYFRMQVLLAHGGERANAEHRAIAAAVRAKDFDVGCAADARAHSRRRQVASRVAARAARSCGAARSVGRAVTAPVRSPEFHRTAIGERASPTPGSPTSIRQMRTTCSAHVPKGTVDDVAAAVAAASAAYPAWRATPGPARAELLYKWAAAIAARQEELAQVVTREVGKPIGEARGEVGAVRDDPALLRRRSGSRGSAT